MKILVVDDHALVRDGLRPLLSGIQGDVAVLEAGSYAAAALLVDEHPDLDLVLLDFNLPNVAGFAALVDLQERHPEIPVVVMSGRDDPQLVRETLERGALGFIPKTSSTSVIQNALRLVLAGGTYVPREALEARPPSPAPVETAPRGDPATIERLGITPRQADVLMLMLAGKPNKVICRELHLAEGTVKSHVAAVLRALGAANRVEVIVAAAKLGLKV